MADTLDFTTFEWLNPPRHTHVEPDRVTLTTDPQTDFWQRTYYGFRNDNAHALVTAVSDLEFTFSVRASFTPARLFDQSGVVVYQDSDNWLKASIEYDNPAFARLGCVVTNLGYSDWSSEDVDPSLRTLVYRVSRRGQDFLVEHSLNGEHFHQLRLAHLHQPLAAARIGIYACSPLQSSIPAEFSDARLGPCVWAPYVNPDTA